jgi:hypothetical protein
MNAMAKKKGPHVSKKFEAINTITPGPVTLTDTDIQTLDSIVRHWNMAAPKDPPTWDAPSALAELARLQLVSMRADYGSEQRKPAYEAQQPPSAPATPPLDSPIIIP